MYSIVKLTDNITIKSQNIKKNLKESVKDLLIKNYEGKITPKLDNYIVKIVDVNEKNIRNGLINDINGDVVYSIEYTAVIFDPITNFVFDVRIIKCSDIGIWGYPLLCYKELEEGTLEEVELCRKKECKVECISTFEDLSKDYIYDEDNCSFVHKTNKSIIKKDSIIKFSINSKQIECNKISILGIPV